MAKFKDPDTEEIVEIQEFKCTYKGGITVYKDKFDKPLVNAANKPLEFINEKVFDPDNIPMLCTFNSKSSADKTAILKKRASEHYKKEIKERQVNMNGGTSKQS